MAPERAGQAGVSRHLDAGGAREAQGRGRGLLPALPRSARYHVPPLLRVPSSARGQRHACLAGGATGGTFSRAAVQGTACTRHLPFSSHPLAIGSSREGLPGFVAQPTPRWAPRGAHLHRQLFFGQRRAAACRLGGGCGRRAGQPQGHGLWSGAVRRAPEPIFVRWRRLCGGDGRAILDGPAHAAHRLRKYHRYSQWAKVQSIGSKTHPRAHFWSRLLAPHDLVRAVKVKGHATLRDVEAGRSSHLFKRGNDFADLFAKKGADAHKPPFRIAKTMVACTSLARQAARGAAEAHVLLRLRGWDDTQAAAPRTRTRPARAKFEAEIAAPAAGKAGDWLAPHVPSAISQDSLAPVPFVGTACN